jgi:hypothetical protein
MSLTKKITDSLRKDRSKIMQETLDKFKSKHGFEDQELKKKLEREADRVYPMIDESIANERVHRTGFTFLTVAALGSLLAVTLGGSILLVIATSAIAGAAQIQTIGITYNARVIRSHGLCTIASRKRTI